MLSDYACPTTIAGLGILLHQHMQAWEVATDDQHSLRSRGVCMATAVKSAARICASF